MQPQQTRLPDDVIERLRAQARARNLSFSAHLRSQLTASSFTPHDITKTFAEAAR